MRNCLLFLGLIAFSYLANAQNITGKITDAQTGDGLIYVYVTSENNIGTVSDEEGHYQLNLPVGEHKISFSFLGYATQVKTVNIINTDAKITLNIALSQSATALETVVLTAGKFEQKIEETSISLEVIKPNLIEEKNTIELQNALDQTPGVNVVEDQVNIRSGSGWSFGAGSRVLMMVDDMPLMSPDAGQIQWKLLPNEAVHQMEIIKGASSAMYGTSAMNGLINVRTVLPTEVPKTEVSVFGGFYNAPSRKSAKWWNGTQGFTGATFMHAKKIKNTEIAFSGLLLKDQGFRMGETDDRFRINGKVKFNSKKIKGLSYGVHASALYSEGGNALLWQDLDQAYVPRDSSATQTTGWDYYIDPFVNYHKGNSKHSLKTRYMGINNNAHTDDVNYENYSDYFYGEYQYQHFFMHKLTLTMGAVGALGYSNSEVFKGYHESKNGAVYVQADKAFGRLNISGGLRYETYKLDQRNFSKPVARLGVNFKAAQATYFRASFGQGYRFPSMAEAYTSTFVGSTGVYPNFDLLPESGWTGEIAVKQGFKIGEDWKGFVDVAGFINHFDNMTEFTFGLWGTSPDLLKNLGFKSLNVGPTEIKGLETTVTSQGKIGKVDLRILAGYAYTQPTALEPDKIYGSYNNVDISYTSTSSNPENNILKYRYKHLAKLDVMAEYKKIGFGMSARYNDYMQNIDKIFVESFGSLAFFPGVAESRELHKDGDFLMDLRLSYQFKRFKVSAIADNVFNQEYFSRPSYMGPPRKFTLKVFYKI